MLQITSEQRRELRARAHGLNPVVSISENGLTDNVLKEIDLSLKAHELIKIRVYGDNREERVNFMGRICEELATANIQMIGKLLVVWRPNPVDAAVNSGQKSNSRRAEPRKTKRSFQG